MPLRKQGKPLCDAQIRLTLPRSWIEELDTIAASRHMTRLALIRGYLRSRINKDLENLANHWGIVQRNKETCQKLRKVTAERQRRREYDRWE